MQLFGVITAIPILSPVQSQRRRLHAAESSLADVAGVVLFGHDDPPGKGDARLFSGEIWARVDFCGFAALNIQKVETGRLQCFFQGELWIHWVSAEITALMEASV
jgi:hypothetical protein